MPVSADYETIRDENIARYGWDTAVLDLLGQLYSERTHFIFELIQNAEDAGATELAFELFDDRLEVRHDGRPFTEADVRGVCGVGTSEKSSDLTKIGQFGIGFKSVYAYTKSPRIHSAGKNAGEHFRIEMYVRPYAVDPPADGAVHLADGTGGTLFVFPFDHDTVPAAVAAGEIAAALNTIEPGTLLFLRNISRLRAGGVGVSGSVIERRATHRTAARRHVTLSTGRGRPDEEWLVWHRQTDAPGHPAQPAEPARPAGPAQRAEPARSVEVAFRVAAGGGEHRIAACGRSPLTVFFPTEKETFLGFLIQGPYRTTPARDNVPEHDPSNQALVRQTAGLLPGVLRELRADGLLTADALGALPLDVGHFPPGSMFRPLFDSVREALAAGKLIPAAGAFPAAEDAPAAGTHSAAGTHPVPDAYPAPAGYPAPVAYRAAANLKLPRAAGLDELLGPDQLGALFDAGRPLYLVHRSITPDLTPLLWRYLRDELGVSELTPADVLAMITPDFLAAQSDGWITRFYAFLYQSPALWHAAGFPGDEPGPARTRPIIRLEDGRHVAPFDALGHPAVYLPGASGTSLPTVRRSVAGSPVGRPFLDALNLTEPDVVAEVLQIVLPRYDGLELAGLDLAQHEADCERVVRALDEATAGQRPRLLDRLQRTTFLIGENAATGVQRLIPPTALYQRSKELESYLDGNPDAWFAGDGYGPWLVQLREMGVREAVEVRARTPGQLGHVVIVDEFARQERGLDGFDPGAQIDGLDFALQRPTHARSEYVWNVLLGAHRGLVAGVVEKAIRPSFADSTLENVRSAIGAAAASHAWLPGPDGAFRWPAELSLDDLPPTFTRDETLAHALGMLQPVVAEAARQLGVPAGVLRGLSAHPDLVALVERELRARTAGEGPGPG
jgi:hypothetical protein